MSYVSAMKDYDTLNASLIRPICPSMREEFRNVYNHLGETHRMELEKQLTRHARVASRAREGHFALRVQNIEPSGDKWEIDIVDNTGGDLVPLVLTVAYASALYDKWKPDCWSRVVIYNDGVILDCQGGINAPGPDVIVDSIQEGTGPHRGYSRISDPVLYAKLYGPAQAAVVAGDHFRLRVPAGTSNVRGNVERFKSHLMEKPILNGGGGGYCGRSPEVTSSGVNTLEELLRDGLVRFEEEIRRKRSIVENDYSDLVGAEM
jgi:hypothetical protein